MTQAAKNPTTDPTANPTTNPAAAPETPDSPQWVAVQKTSHQHARWLKHSHYNFAKNDAVAPVLLAELTQLLPFYPLAFVAAEQGFQLVALQSIQPNLNLYLSAEGKWRVPYVPSTYRSHPFMLAAKNAEEWVLCIDQNSEFVRLNPETDQAASEENAQGEPLFTPENQLTEPTAQILDFLQQCQANKQLTQQAVNLLEQHNLIAPWPLEQSQNNTTKPVNGVYQINATALNQLSGDALEQLNQHHALELAYAQLHSKPRIHNFETLSQLHQQEQQNTAENLDLDQLFGEQEDDMFKF